LREQLPAGALLVLPFSGAPHDARPLVHLPGFDDEPARRRVGLALQALLAEPALPSPFALPDRVLRVEERLGWRAWLASSVYRERFRALGVARLLVAALTDPAGVPRGLLMLGRAESEAAFDERELALVLTCRDELESALAPLPPWPESGPADVLAAITAALPAPAVLLGADGHVLWMSDAAAKRLGVVEVTVGKARFFVTTGQALGELIARGSLELRSPERASEAGAQPPSWLHPGETLTVRRHAGVEPRVLVCLHAATADDAFDPPAATPRNALGLSTREGDIAALAAEGYSVLAIASRLGIAESTVSSHLKRVYRKLGVRSRAELASRVVRAR
jgi:DNA-binding CsgD family transcriptional regulator/PAS domain-containing protein